MICNPKNFRLRRCLRHTYLSLIFMIISYMDTFFGDSKSARRRRENFRGPKISPPQAENFWSAPQSIWTTNAALCHDDNQHRKRARILSFDVSWHVWIYFFNNEYLYSGSCGCFASDVYVYNCVNVWSVHSWFWEPKCQSRSTRHPPYNEIVLTQRMAKSQNNSL